MSSTINVNYMTRTYSNFLKGYEAKNGSQAQSSSFSGSVAKKSAKSQKVSEMGKAGAVSTKNMTMEEYKQYIHNKISQIPMHPSRMQESISINISEAGFEAMKNDPEYEAWVLNDLRTGWAQPDRWAGICGGAYSTIYYGATKEECHAEMWSAGYQNGSGKLMFDSKAKDSFWERRVEQKKWIEAQVKEQQEKKRIQKEAYEKEAYEKETVYSNSVLSKSAGAVTLSTANAAYEAHKETVTFRPESSDEVMQAWDKALAKTGVNPFPMNRISTALVLHVESGQQGLGSTFLGDSTDSAKFMAEKIIHRLENPLTPAADPNFARQELIFYKKFMELLG